MIAWILIILGAILTIGSLIGFFSLLILPIKERFEIVYDREYDYIRSRTDAEVRKHVRAETKRLIRDFIIMFFVGILMFFSGLYLGYAAKGEDFWFYKKFYPSKEETLLVWDSINENGQYVANDGKTYTYYILVNENTVSLRGEPCDSPEELKAGLSDIQRENKIILIDCYAIASTYHEVADILKELGLKYEETKK